MTTRAPTTSTEAGMYRYSQIQNPLKYHNFWGYKIFVSFVGESAFCEATCLLDKVHVYHDHKIAQGANCDTPLGTCTV